MNPSLQSAAPKTIAEACDLVRRAHQAGARLLAVGGGTKRAWVSRPTEPCIEMDMRGLNRVVEYSPEDMTITVEAGMTLGALRELLTANGQRVTLDPPNADRATLGGILAANDSGPTRFAYGTARDIVLGMNVIEPDGEIVKSGGKVVKNVAGYDLHKLHIGGFGSMGPIATATFRLRPLPEARGLVVMTPRDAAQAEDFIASVLAGETRPALVELLNGRMAAAVKLLGRLTLIIGYEDNLEAVTWQMDALARSLGGVVLSEPDAHRIYPALCEAAGAAVETSFKATMLSSEVAGFVARADGLPVRIIARAGNGVVHGLLEEPIGDDSWLEWESAAVAGGGSLQLRGRLPGAGLPRMGRPRGDAWLSEAVQKAFDPGAMFAPERLT